MDAVGPILTGSGQAQQYVNQAAQAEQQAKDVKLQSTEVSEQRREQLNASLSIIQANRAQSGLSIDSPTAMAIQNAVKGTASRSEQMARVGFLNQQGALSLQSKSYRSAASNAMIGGYIGAYKALENDAAKAMGA